MSLQLFRRKTLWINICTLHRIAVIIFIDFNVLLKTERHIFPMCENIPNVSIT